MAQQAASRDAHEHDFEVFVRLWAAVILFSQLSSFFWLTQLFTGYGLSSCATFVVASWIVFRGATHRGALLLLACSIAQSGFQLPYLPNHEHVVLFFNLYFAVKMLWGKVSNSTDRDRLVEELRTYSRWLLILVYGFACFAKLNADYFDPRYSCSVVFYDNIAGKVALLPANVTVHQLIIYGSVLVEALIPLWLIRKKTIRFAVVLGLLFHFFLSWDVYRYFINFSALMSVLLLLLLPRGYLAFVGSTNNRLLSASVIRPFVFALPSRTVPWLAILLFVATVVLGILNETSVKLSDAYSAYFRFALWLSFSIPLLLSTYVYLSRRPPKAVTSTDTIAGSERNLRPIEIGLLLLVVVNGLSPYTGLKTRTAFNMYSNLRIEPQYSNHFLVSNSLDLFSYFSQQGEIDSEEENICWNTLLKGARYPRVEILRSALFCPQEEIPYIFEGGREVLNTPDGAPLELGWFDRKIPIFRPLGPRAATECFW